MKAGIVGLPNVGKSSLFNALSSSKAHVANFPFCTIEPNVGVINVVDERLDVLAKLVKPQRIVPTSVEIVDIAGLVKGASKGEGLGNQFLANIKETDAIIHVIRCFSNDNVVHVDGSIDPVRDKTVIDTELQLKDLEFIEKQLSRLDKQKRGDDKGSIIKKEILLQKVQKHLSQGLNVRSLVFSDEEKILIEPLRLLSQKPVIYVCNVDEASVTSGNTYSQKIQDIAHTEGAQCLLLSVAIESEIAAMDSIEDRRMFLEDLGLNESGLVRLVRHAYDSLDLITYFTCGVKELRAWTILRNTLAPKAAGVIHSDFEKGFIRAEIISYKDFIHYGSEQACKDAGKLSIHGKDYVMQDGDIVHFRFNV